ncbi:killer toxin sensitivity protein (Iki1) [Histoplasma capsulatum var. duboisii H88]|uniref:Killer toxin sensitivity protein (Iki1) n=1 Tax=Ajellomyces capsulatus (strain H88) TaxID=544711 RepID=A0A8A1L994_AJEC8|nr:killer toxin sensitivity protein (Iki1) [Histoplasma capsulatum var. duboisii H88]
MSTETNIIHTNRFISSNISRHNNLHRSLYESHPRRKGRERQEPYGPRLRSSRRSRRRHHRPPHRARQEHR